MWFQPHQPHTRPLSLTTPLTTLSRVSLIRASQTTLQVRASQAGAFPAHVNSAKTSRICLALLAMLPDRVRTQRCNPNPFKMCQLKVLNLTLWVEWQKFKQLRDLPSLLALSQDQRDITSRLILSLSTIQTRMQLRRQQIQRVSLGSRAKSASPVLCLKPPASKNRWTRLIFSNKSRQAVVSTGTLLVCGHAISFQKSVYTRS